MRVQGPSSGLSRLEPEAFSPNRTLALPFLPTLFTALVIAGLSLLCRQPAEAELPEPTAITAAGLPTSAVADTFASANAADAAAAAPIPATIAFGQLYPLTPASPLLGQNVKPAPHVASAAKRGCAGGRCEAKRTDTVRSAANPPRPEAPLPLPFVAREDEDNLPTGALPFVPTAASVIDTVRALGDEAKALGGSVLGTVALLR